MRALEGFGGHAAAAAPYGGSVWENRSHALALTRVQVHRTAVSAGGWRTEGCTLLLGAGVSGVLGVAPGARARSRPLANPAQTVTTTRADTSEA